MAEKRTMRPIDLWRKLFYETEAAPERQIIIFEAIAAILEEVSRGLPEPPPVDERFPWLDYLVEGGDDESTNQPEESPAS